MTRTVRRETNDVGHLLDWAELVTAMAGDRTETFRIGSAMMPDVLPGFEVQMVFDEGGSVIEFTIRPEVVDGPPYQPNDVYLPAVGAITAKAVRSVPFDAIARACALGVPDYRPMNKRPGRAGRSDEAYAEYAAMYVEAVRSGSHKPATVVADRMHTGARNVAGIILEARRRGLLTPTSKGKAGGALTAKAVALLPSA